MGTQWKTKLNYNWLLWFCKHTKQDLLANYKQFRRYKLSQMDKTQRKIDAALVCEARRDAEVLQLEAKWKGNSGSEKPCVTFGPGSELEKLFGFPVLPPVTQDPTKVRCSFCGKDVDRVNATHGIGRLKMGTTQVIASLDGVYRYRESRSLCLRLFRKMNNELW